jgi:hypothetical protein
MKYIKKWNLNESLKEIEDKDLDWDFIKDSMIDSFDNVDYSRENSFVKFHFYGSKIITEEYPNSKPYIWYDTYEISKSNVTDIVNVDTNLIKKENRNEYFKGRFPKGSFLYGVELNLYIGQFSDQYRVINSISDLNKTTKYFRNCSDLVADCEATIKRVNDKYDYKISFKNELIKYEESGHRRGEFEQGYSISLCFFNSEVIDDIKNYEPDFRLKNENWIK